MCFYERMDYRCGDFKWGNMKHRCERQHRMGETCGQKLLDDGGHQYSPDICRICQDIETKKRRLEKEQSNIKRWRVDTRNNFAASIIKAERESQILLDQIEELTQRRSLAKFGKGGLPGAGESKPGRDLRK
jgi:hypothetical protein